MSAHALSVLELPRVLDWVAGRAFSEPGKSALRALTPSRDVDRVRGESKMSGRIVVEALILVTWWGLRDRVLRLGR